MADDEFDLDSEDAQVLDPNIRRELRDGRKRASDLQKELDQSRREAAFARAGVDDSTPLGRMFVRGYEGDASVEAIKTAAEEIPGLLATPSVKDAMSTEELEAQRRMAGASGGAGAGGPDLRARFEADAADLERRIRAGQAGPEDVMELIRNADPSLGIVQKGIQ